MTTLFVVQVVLAGLCLYGLSDAQKAQQGNRHPNVIKWSDLQQGGVAPSLSDSDTDSADDRGREILARINAKAGLTTPKPGVRASDENGGAPKRSRHPGRGPTPTAAVSKLSDLAASIPSISTINPTSAGGLNSALGNLALNPSLLSGLGGGAASGLPNLGSLPGGFPGGLGGLPGGLGGLPGGLGGLPGGLSGIPGLGSLLPQSPTALGGPLAGSSAGGNPATSGLVNALSSLGGQLGRSLGLGNLLNQAGVGSVLGGARGGPPVPGFPAIPGLQGLGGQNPQFDVMGLVGGLSRRALNGSTLADIVPPDRIEAFADNLTEVLVPEMPNVDLAKYMGRWFEGINSPRATSQRCVVHHYGGLTENGKTATFTALKIYRDGNEFGQVQYSIGYAFRGGRQQSMLQMHSSESQDAIPYWVYHLGPVGKDAFGNPQYEYAVVSNWIRYPLTVLVRDPDNFKKNYEIDVLRWLEDHGFVNDFARTFNLIQPADYSNCQYSDNTFAAFGK